MPFVLCQRTFSAENLLIQDSLMYSLDIQQKALSPQPQPQCTLIWMDSKILLSSQKMLSKSGAFCLMLKSASSHLGFNIRKATWADHPSWVQRRDRSKTGALQQRLSFKQVLTEWTSFSWPLGFLKFPRHFFIRNRFLLWKFSLESQA